MAPRTQLKRKRFCVVIEDPRHRREVLDFIRARGGHTVSSFHHQRLDYIVIDLPFTVSSIDIPVDEPHIAWTRDNMIRLFGNMVIDGQVVRPKDRLPRVVSHLWVKQASSAYTAPYWFEGRYADFSYKSIPRWSDEDTSEFTKRAVEFQPKLYDKSKKAAQSIMKKAGQEKKRRRLEKQLDKEERAREVEWADSNDE